MTQTEQAFPGGGTMVQPAQAERDRILGYLQSQAASKTIDELIERVQEGVNELHAAARELDAAKLDVLCPSEESPGETWTPRQCFEHIVGSNIAVARAVLHVAHAAGLPEPEPANVPTEVEAAIAQHSGAIESLYEHVRAADPAANLETLWRHPMFGDLNWRQWLLFLRIHSKDHARQLRNMDARVPGA
jgi:hypothetical protein